MGTLATNAEKASLVRFLNVEFVHWGMMHQQQSESDGLSVKSANQYAHSLRPQASAKNILYEDQLMDPSPSRYLVISS